MGGADHACRFEGKTAGRVVSVPRPYLTSHLAPTVHVNLFASAFVITQSPSGARSHLVPTPSYSAHISARVITILLCLQPSSTLSGRTIFDLKFRVYGRSTDDPIDNSRFFGEEQRRGELVFEPRVPAQDQKPLRGWVKTDVHPALPEVTLHVLRSVCQGLFVFNLIVAPLADRFA